MNDLFLMQRCSKPSLIEKTDNRGDPTLQYKAENKK